MLILFKQIFRTLRKNFLLISGLFLVVCAVFLIASSTLQLTLSINSSISKINNEGNLANAVSNNLPSLGSLVFEYKKNTVPETNKIITSSLELQKNEKTGKYEQWSNTLFPYEKSDFVYMVNGKKNYVRKNIRDGKRSLSGIKIDNNANLDNKFTFVSDANYSEGYPIWETNMSILSSALNGSNNYQAKSFSLVNSKGEVLLNPKSIIFNKSGYPIYNFVNGSFSETIYAVESFGELKDMTTPRNENPFGRVKKTLDSSFHNPEASYNMNISPLVFKNTHTPLDGLSLYTKEELTPSYRFKINLEKTDKKMIFFLNQLEGYKEIDIINEAFKKSFYELFITVNNSYNNSIVDPIFYDSDKKEIVLTINDNAFVDYNSNISFDEQINSNKELFLNSFADFLSIKISSKINEIFNEFFNDFLDSKDIIHDIHNEYLYSNPTTKEDFLFVKKGNENINNIILQSGVNIEQNYFNLSEYSKYPEIYLYTKYFISDYYYVFDKLVENIDENNENYDVYQLLLFILSKINKESSKLDIWLTESIMNSTYFKYLLSLIPFIEVTNNIEGIFFKFKYGGIFTVVNPAHFKTIIYEINNLLVVVSNSYAIENKKNSLPINMTDENIDIWLSKIKLPLNEFSDWIDKIQGTNLMLISKSFMENFINYNDKFLYWMEKLPNNYKITYKDKSFLISGIGLSPNFAFPVISDIAPIPNPKKQAIIYVNKSTFDSLGINSTDIYSYINYFSHTKSNNEIVNELNTVFQYFLGENSSIEVFDIYNAKKMTKVWLRVYFPKQLRNFVVISGVLLIIFLMLLAFLVIYFLIKTIANNLLQSLAIVLSNGISKRHIILSCVANISIISLFATFIAYIISYFLQSAILSVLSPLIFAPTYIIPFNPLILIPLILIGVLFTGGIFAWVLSRKFKSTTTDIIANHDTPKSNKLFNKLLSANIKIPSIPKLSIAFSSSIFGRIILLTILGSLSLGVIVSTTIIKDKFVISQTLTNSSRNYENEINLVNIKEASGLYKYQPYSELGFTDESRGIESLYNIPGKYPSIYNKENLVVREVINNDVIQPKKYVDGDQKGQKYLTNLILPSYAIYKELTSYNSTLLFNSVASLFVLDAQIKLFGQKINIWDNIRSYFPEWLVFQFENQLMKFRENVMNKYGEMYLNFLNVNKKSMNDTMNENKMLEIKDVDYTKNGLYYAEYKKNNKIYTTKPTYIWSDNNQIYHNENNSNQIIAKNSNVKFDISNEKFYEDEDKNPFTYNPQSKTINPVWNNVKWIFIPAYETNYTLDDSRTVVNSVSPDDISFNKQFLEFITIIFGDDELSKYNSKMSFGIVPVNDDDETYTNVNIKINSLYDIFNKPYEPKVNITNIMGINPKSKLVKLENEWGNDLLHLLAWNESNILPKEIPVVINEPAMLEWGLKVGDIIKITVNNNVINNSYNILNSFIKMNYNPLDLEFTLVVKGINSDSFGTRIYMNQDIANILTGLDQISVISSLDNGSVVRQKPNYKPFNAILSNDKNQEIGSNIIPFYSNTGLWDFSLSIDTIKNVNNRQLIDLFVTENQDILKIAAHKIGIDTNLPINTIREKIIYYLQEIFSISYYKQSIQNIQGESSLLLSISSMLPKNVSNEMYDIISNFFSNIVYILIAVLIPLLLVIIFITSFSIVEDIFKRISIMKILGINNKEIAKTILLMYLPIMLGVVALGTAIVFAAVYSLQYLIYNVTTIFISAYISFPILAIGIFAIIMIFIASLIFMFYKLKKKQIANAVKF